MRVWAKLDCQNFVQIAAKRYMAVIGREIHVPLRTTGEFSPVYFSGAQHQGVRVEIRSREEKDKRKRDERRSNHEFTPPLKDLQRSSHGLAAHSS
ncbi:MAG: hypothetical protein U0Q18_03110 [Bryobacteraceae bacterium]